MTYSEDNNCTTKGTDRKETTFSSHSDGRGRSCTVADAAAAATAAAAAAAVAAAAANAVNAANDAAWHGDALGSLHPSPVLACALC